MPIAFSCTCGRSLRAKDELAGKRTKCPGCGAILAIPEPAKAPSLDEEVAGYLLDSTAAPPAPAPSRPDPPREDRPAILPSPSDAFIPAVTRKRQSEPAPVRSITKPWMDTSPSKGAGSEYLYWIFLLTLIPLVISLLSNDSQDIAVRLVQTLEHSSPEQAERLEKLLERDVSTEELFQALPEGKLYGAHLSHGTVMHWVYAGMAAVAFLSLLLLMFSVERSTALHLFGIGMFTGTIGIIFLFAVQLCSQIQMGRIHGRGLVAIFMLIIAFIGWSYRSALDPDSNLILSAIGFTFGVGFCEELTKAIPILFTYKGDTRMGWRGACLWGLASGIGFGVSEGIMYSADSYNGIGGVDAYVVRFISCVGLHAMWAAAVGITISRTRDEYDAVHDWSSALFYLFRVLWMPMVLHGLYDTLLKKDMNIWALVVALASFAWFVYQIESARGAMPEAGPPKTKRILA